jgi:hypothetical protein
MKAPMSPWMRKMLDVPGNGHKLTTAMICVGAARGDAVYFTLNEELADGTFKSAPYSFTRSASGATLRREPPPPEIMAHIKENGEKAYLTLKGLPYSLATGGGFTILRYEEPSVAPRQFIVPSF